MDSYVMSLTCPLIEGLGELQLPKRLENYLGLAYATVQLILRRLNE